MKTNVYRERSIADWTILRNSMTALGLFAAALILPELALAQEGIINPSIKDLESDPPIDGFTVVRLSLALMLLCIAALPWRMSVGEIRLNKSVTSLVRGCFRGKVDENTPGKTN